MLAINYRKKKREILVVGIVLVYQRKDRDNIYVIINYKVNYNTFIFVIQCVSTLWKLPVHLNE